MTLGERIDIWMCSSFKANNPDTNKLCFDVIQACKTQQSRIVAMEKVVNLSRKIRANKFNRTSELVLCELALDEALADLDKAKREEQ